MRARDWAPLELPNQTVAAGSFGTGGCVMHETRVPLQSVWPKQHDSAGRSRRAYAQRVDARVKLLLRCDDNANVPSRSRPVVVGLEIEGVVGDSQRHDLATRAFVGWTLYGEGGQASSDGGGGASSVNSLMRAGQAYDS
ncbi:hypothetical protein LIA77_01112 [Sarocladium implicatum]|nr:hypothetical protein LIA77_01112 [Sarocladium implicatum]